ncbi:unnamed protein product [Leptidea sinapis]|uniref:SH2 domain-containing protein n=1 Tax=Leptidea sinapis TaxID=189913 RepID=A0A5E4Q897_9NEOP|nr:unnamed protein product [Leptidea sinapis]
MVPAWDSTSWGLPPVAGEGRRVRQSSQPDTMAISVRLPAEKGPYIEHYLIQASGGQIGLETSHNRFDNIPELIAHYSQLMNSRYNCSYQNHYEKQRADISLVH